MGIVASVSILAAKDQSILSGAVRWMYLYVYNYLATQGQQTGSDSADQTSWTWILVVVTWAVRRTGSEVFKIYCKSILSPIYNHYIIIKYNYPINDILYLMYILFKPQVHDWLTHITTHISTQLRLLCSLMGRLGHNWWQLAYWPKEPVRNTLFCDLKVEFRMCTVMNLISGDFFL